MQQPSPHGVNNYVPCTQQSRVPQVMINDMKQNFVCPESCQGAEVQSAVKHRGRRKIHTIMTESEGGNVPWKEGFWQMGGFKAMILQTDGPRKMLWKNLVALDYPQITAGAINIDCSFGDFGEARSGNKLNFILLGL